MTNWLTIKDAMALMHASRHAVVELIQEGRIPYLPPKPNAPPHIPKGWFLRWLEGAEADWNSHE